MTPLARLVVLATVVSEAYANDCCEDCDHRKHCDGGWCTWNKYNCHGIGCGKHWCPAGPSPPPTPPTPPPPAPTPPPTPPAPHGDTQTTKDLNQAIAASKFPAVYTNGKGVLVRNPFDGFESDQNKVVIPATLWVNDIFAPSQLYVGWGGGGGNPWCPTSNIDCDASADTGDHGSFNSIQMGYVIHKQIGQLFADWDNVQSDTWGNGVFYASDANSCDLRCAYFKTDTYEGYDCPGGWVDISGKWSADSTKKGAGGYNGKGCHFNHVNGIDQTNAKDSKGVNLVGNYQCECDYSFKQDWSKWVDQWTSLSDLKANKGKGASWAMDLAACWLNNPRDMINLQNQLYWKRSSWNDQKTPQVTYKTGDATANRPYWGWNEVPVSRAIATNQKNWDAIVIKLPAAVCGGNGQNDLLSCISAPYQIEFEKQLTEWYQAGYLNHEIVIVREYMDSTSNYFRQFFCEQWTSPNKLYTINYDGNQCTFQAQSDALFEV